MFAQFHPSGVLRKITENGVFFSFTLTHVKEKNLSRPHREVAVRSPQFVVICS